MSGKRIYVGNIPSDCRERDLERFFKGFGRIRFVLRSLLKLSEIIGAV